MAWPDRVSLAFNSSGQGGVDGPALNEEEQQARDDYHHGGAGQRRAFGPHHRRFSERKRALLEGHGMKEGRDFVVNPENGKTYSIR